MLPSDGYLYCAPTLPSCGFAGIVSIGFIHATPGDMKSFKSSAERMALIVNYGGGGVASVEYEVQKRPTQTRRKDAMQRILVSHNKL
jgi:hypothetical protein